MGQQPNKYHITDDGKVYCINDDGSYTYICDINDFDKLKITNGDFNLSKNSPHNFPKDKPKSKSPLRKPLNKYIRIILSLFLLGLLIIYIWAMSSNIKNNPQYMPIDNSHLKKEPAVIDSLVKDTLEQNIHKTEEVKNDYISPISNNSSDFKNERVNKKDTQKSKGNGLENYRRKYIKGEDDYSHNNNSTSRDDDVKISPERKGKKNNEADIPTCSTNNSNEDSVKIIKKQPKISYEVEREHTITIMVNGKEVHKEVHSSRKVEECK